MSETYEVNGKEYTKEEVEQAIKLTKDAWSRIKQVISDVVEAISDVVRRIRENLENKRSNDDPKKNWFVPVDTRRNSQVMTRKPLSVVRRMNM